MSAQKVRNDAVGNHHHNNRQHNNHQFGNRQFSNGGNSGVAAPPLSLVPLSLANTIAEREGVSREVLQKTARSHNKILAALPEDAWQSLLPHLRRVLLHQNHILHEQDSRIEYVYFVENGLVSLVMDASCDSQIEAAMIGSEGMVGAMSILGNYPSVHRAMVQIPGKAYRLPVGVLREEWKRNPDLQEWLFSYANLLMAQVSQTVLCGRIHTIEERLNRWLLAARDRIEADNLELTHDHIAQMLGVRRPGVTVALGVLQQSGLIECGRGQINIKNAAKLERCACECYSILRQKFQSFETGIGVD